MSVDELQQTINLQKTRIDEQDAEIGRQNDRINTLSEQLDQLLSRPRSSHKMVGMIDLSHLESATGAQPPGAVGTASTVATPKPPILERTTGSAYLTWERLMRIYLTSSQMTKQQAKRMIFGCIRKEPAEKVSLFAEQANNDNVSLEEVFTRIRNIFIPVTCHAVARDHFNRYHQANHQSTQDYLLGIKDKFILAYPGEDVEKSELLLTRTIDGLVCPMVRQNVQRRDPRTFTDMENQITLETSILYPTKQRGARPEERYKMTSQTLNEPSIHSFGSKEKSSRYCTVHGVDTHTDRECRAQREGNHSPKGRRHSPRRARSKSPARGKKKRGFRSGSRSRSSSKTRHPGIRKVKFKGGKIAYLNEETGEILVEGDQVAALEAADFHDCQEEFSGDEEEDSTDMAALFDLEEPSIQALDYMDMGHRNTKEKLRLPKPRSRFRLKKGKRSLRLKEHYPELFKNPKLQKAVEVLNDLTQEYGWTDPHKAACIIDYVEHRIRWFKKYVPEYFGDLALSHDQLILEEISALEPAPVPTSDERHDHEGKLKEIREEIINAKPFGDNTKWTDLDLFDTMEHFFNFSKGPTFHQWLEIKNTYLKGELTEQTPADVIWKDLFNPRENGEYTEENYFDPYRIGVDKFKHLIRDMDIEERKLLAQKIKKDHDDLEEQWRQEINGDSEVKLLDYDFQRRLLDEKKSFLTKVHYRRIGEVLAARNEEQKPSLPQ